MFKRTGKAEVTGVLNTPLDKTASTERQAEDRKKKEAFIRMDKPLNQTPKK